MAYSFSKADRILKRKDYQRLYEEGKKVQNNHFILVYCSGKTERHRLGITVSKKVGNAVVRNRIKRFIREFFRLNRHTLTGIWDINIIAKHHTAGLNFFQVCKSLADLIMKVKIL